MSEQDGFQYDAFISYSTAPDYARARKVEAFLESFHKALAPAGVSIKQLQICRDGSDFRLPRNRQNALADNDPIWQIIVGELSKARYLIVLCSPESTRSPWVAQEIAWILDQRGPDFILPIVTKASDPSARPEESFPAQLTAAGLHKARLWYDLRSWGDTPAAGKVRDAEDELVRLASDLLGWDSSKNGQLAPLWLREQLKKRRRQAVIAIAVAAVLVLAAAVVVWRSIVASREASRAKANAIVLAADSSSDPLAGALLLAELQEYDEPDDGTRVARRLASSILPTALVRGHTQRLTKVAFSPDQTRLLTASKDGTARLWPADGKGDPVILAQHGDVITDARFSSDGSLIATISKDKTAKVWGPQGGGPQQTYEHDSPVVNVQFSSDKEWLATVSEKGMGQLWSLKGNDKRVISLPDNRQVVSIWLSSSHLGGLIAASDVTVWRFRYDGQGNLTLEQVLRSAKDDDENFPKDLLDKVTFSPDGSHVAVVFSDKILVRRIEDKKASILAHGAGVSSVDFNVDGTQLVSSCSDGKIRLWQTDTGALNKTLDVALRYFSLDLSNAKPLRENRVMSANSARFSHDGKRVAALFDDGILRMWNVGYDGETTEIYGTQGVNLVAFSRDDTQLITGADDGTARVWPLTSRTEPLVVQHNKSVYAASMSEDGTKVATGSRDGITRLWQVNDPSNQVQLKGVEATIKGVAFNTSGTLLATAQDNGFAAVWDITNWSSPVLKKQFSGSAKLQGVQFSRNGDRILAWSDNGAIYIWPIDGSAGTVLQAEHGSVWHAEFNPQANQVLTAYDDGTVRLWNADGSGSYITLVGHTETVFRAVFNHDGSRLLTVSDDGSLRLWRGDGRGDPLVLSKPYPGNDGLENCAFSPDGKKFVVSSSAGRAWVYSVEDAGKPTVLRATHDVAHIGSIMAIAFSPDNEQIVTAGLYDGAVRVWQVDGNGRPVTLNGHEGAITWAAFSYDGSRVVTASEDGTARIWRIGWRDLVAHLRQLTSASLTMEQRMIYLGEIEADARTAYEQAEKRFGRTPLPANWQFNYTF